MSFSVYFNNISKVENSTKAFSLTGLTPYDCVLKSGCSVSNPTIEIQVSFSDFAALSSCNVAYISDFSRYYFITDWRYTGRLAVCTLAVDVLASFWTALSSKSFYVTRSASTTNPNIVDTAYPATAQARIEYVSSAENPFQPGISDYGCYIVGIISKDSGLDGCITYYVMGYLQFMVLMGKMYDITTNGYDNLGTTGTNNDTFTQELCEAIVNPLAYIASIMWYPFSVTSLNTLGWLSSTTNVSVGYVSLAMGTTVYYFENAVLYKQITNVISFTITHHPDSATANYLNLSPYAEYRLNFYPFGAFTIDPEYVHGASTLYCMYTVDLRTGRGILNVGTSVNGTDSATWKMPAAFLTSEAQVGVPIPTSTIETQIGDKSNLIEAGVLTGSKLFSGVESKISQGFKDITRGSSAIGRMSSAMETVSDVVGTISENFQNMSVSDIESALLQASASPNMGGTQGSISLFPKQPVSFHEWYKYRANTDNTHKGTPLCDIQLLSTLTGFTVCANAIADVQNANYAEKRKIESYLNTGFYIEPDNYLRILEQPVDFYGVNGQTAYFYIYAENVAAYRWQYSTDGVTWTNYSLSDGTAAALTFTNNATARSRVYRCRLTDSNSNQYYSNIVRVYLS